MAAGDDRRHLGLLWCDAGQKIPAQSPHDQHPDAGGYTAVWSRPGSDNRDFIDASKAALKDSLTGLPMPSCASPA